MRTEVLLSHPREFRLILRRPSDLPSRPRSPRRPRFVLPLTVVVGPPRLPVPTPRWIQSRYGTLPPSARKVARRTLGGNSPAADSPSGPSADFSWPHWLRGCRPRASVALEMTSDRTKPGAAFVVTVVVVVVLSATLAYAGAYLWMVRRPAFSVVGGDLVVGTRRSRIAERWASNQSSARHSLLPRIRLTGESDPISGRIIHSELGRHLRPSVEAQVTPTPTIHRVGGLQPAGRLPAPKPRWIQSGNVVETPGHPDESSYRHRRVRLSRTSPRRYRQPERGLAARRSDSQHSRHLVGRSGDGRGCLSAVVYCMDGFSGKAETARM